MSHCGYSLLWSYYIILHSLASLNYYIYESWRSAVRLKTVLLLGRWRCPQAGTCGPPACWGTQPPGQQHAPDTWLTRWNTFCRYASQPCSGARSDADQVTSGSPLRSCHRRKNRGWLSMIEQLGCKIPILTAWKSRTCVCFKLLHAVCAHAGPKLKAKTQPHSFHGKFKNSRQTTETARKWEAE